MTFNAALAGLNAASNDLRITGHNIANASTHGFKRSRAEFGDVYASTLLGNGRNLIGSGVKLANVAQQFEQGTITFTNNSLDLAIDGNGFFVINQGGTRAYTRAGLFGLDSSGFVVTNSGARVQGFSISDSGAIGGTLGDMRISSDNLRPRNTTLVESQLNLDARSPILSRIGSTIETEGGSIGVARAGIPQATPSVINTTGAPVPFDYGIDSSSSLAARQATTPFNFSVNQPSNVSGLGSVTGFDFSLNTPSSLTAASAPINFNFSDKPTAISGSSSFAGHDFSGGNNASFDISIAGSSADGTRTINLNTNESSLAGLITTINTQLAGIGVTARVDPNNSNRLQFVSSSTGQASVITLNNFSVNGTTTSGNLSGVLSGITSGTQSVPTSFDVTVSGATTNGTATVLLTNNISSLPALIADVRDQLSASGLSVDVREDPLNAGRLQFFATDNGVASTIAVGNYRTTNAGVSVNDITNVLRLNTGASSQVPGPGGVGVTGSLTRASFDVSIANGTGPNGTATRTVVLDRNIANGDLDTLIDIVNSQLTGIDVRAEEDPNSPGRLRFAATVPGEPSTVTIANFQTSGVNGAVTTSDADISAALGGITEGSFDASGTNTQASFAINLSGSSRPSENQTRVIRLDNNIATLQDLINDIRDDLVATGIGVDVREDPSSPGRLQFFALRNGEASTITLNSTGTLTLGSGVTQADLEAVLGGLQLGTNGNTGASNVIPNPSGGTSAVGSVGNRTAASFDITLAGAGINNGTVTINLDSNIVSLQDLINDIRDELSPSGVGIDVQEDPTSPGRLQFYATVPGESSIISINNFNTSNIGVTQTNLANTLRLATGVTETGMPKVANGYLPQTINVVGADGTNRALTTPENATAAQIASLLSSSDVPGISADASSEARIPASGFANLSGTLALSLNGVRLTGSTLAEFADAIENTAGLGTIDATIDANGDLLVTDQVGNDLVFVIEQGSNLDQVQVQGTQGTPVTLTTTGTPAAAIGGSLQVTLEEGVSIASVTPNNNLFGVISPGAFTPFEVNTFDPTNPDTYNHATSVTIFDSLGNPHTMTQYFVRERNQGNTTNNQWTMHVLIDGRNVGDPDPNLPAPQNVEPTLKSFGIAFNPDGSLNAGGTDDMLISNWVPVDAAGVPTGALGPQSVLNGGALPIVEPVTSSNFEIRLGDTTQFGASFGVNAVDQNGFTTGRLGGVDINSDGIIFARYTNGQNQQLGQIALADFANTQGLQPVGDSGWAETMDSGEPVIGAPGSASLGAITSGALEESNVELSEQLVQLIVAQRNYQANARTITTFDEITQSVINI